MPWIRVIPGKMENKNYHLIHHNFIDYLLSGQKIACSIRKKEIGSPRDLLMSEKQRIITEEDFKVFRMND